MPTNFMLLGLKLELHNIGYCDTAVKKIEKFPSGNM